MHMLMVRDPDVRLLVKRIAREWNLNLLVGDNYGELILPIIDCDLNYDVVMPEYETD